MSLHGAHADVEPLGDRLVGEAGRNQLEHLQLPCAQVGDRRGRRGGGSGAQERMQLRDEVAPGWLVDQQDVVCRLEQYQARVGDQRGEQPPLLGRDDAVISRMNDERPRPHLGATSLTSSQPRASNSRTAVSAVVETRSRSSYQAFCSGVPSGRNSALNTCRYVGSTRVQPPRIDATTASSCSRWPRSLRPRTNPPYSTRAVTRSGCRTA